MAGNKENTYMHCVYNAQGFLECQSTNTPQPAEKYTDIVETFIETNPRGKDVDNKVLNLAFTERPTSQTIWDKKSAGIICNPLCAKYEQLWTQGFRSVGGSVCYCQDAPPPATVPSNIKSTQKVESSSLNEPRVYTNAEMMLMNYL